MEATMSAPTYFYPLERFVDGGMWIAGFLRDIVRIQKQLSAPEWLDGRKG
ncbi:hypothetical protein Niako_3458 [Niastella koreensis GR20-10]|uniref:Uncharacterized protein n=1 Tax=Niastella koreensis (strain DSM 17620 / KACC 11465 / NBRC 106392 / GR20-10) TaxID=700598 RepID=G8TKT3_NIAKG|nr:hypothetical protein Niako_3458 [Niastella koreensis GR20-10]